MKFGVLQLPVCFPQLHVGVMVSFLKNRYYYEESDLQAFVEVALIGEIERDVTVLVRGGMFD